MNRNLAVITAGTLAIGVLAIMILQQQAQLSALRGELAKTSAKIAQAPAEAAPASALQAVSARVEKLEAAPGPDLDQAARVDSLADRVKAIEEGHADVAARLMRNEATARQLREMMAEHEKREAAQREQKAEAPKISVDTGDLEIEPSFSDLRDLLSLNPRQAESAAGVYEKTAARLLEEMAAAGAAMPKPAVGAVVIPGGVNMQTFQKIHDQFKAQIADILDPAQKKAFEKYTAENGCVIRSGGKTVTLKNGSASFMQTTPGASATITVN